MKRDIALLKRINDLPIPRDFNPLPDWIKPEEISSLIQREYVNCSSEPIVDEHGKIVIAFGIELTELGLNLIYPKRDWAKISAITAVMLFIIMAVKFILDFACKQP